MESSPEDAAGGKVGREPPWSVAAERSDPSDSEQFPGANGSDGERIERADARALLGRSVDIRTVALVGLFLIAGFYAMYWARPVLLPLVIGVLLAFVLSPVVGFMDRAGLPRGLAAGIVLVSIVGGAAYGVYRLAGPASTWIEDAPASFAQIEQKLRSVTEPVEEVGRATQELDDITRLDDGDGREPQEVRVQERSFSDTIVGEARNFLASGIVVLVLVFFLLASGDEFLEKLTRVLPTLKEKKRAVRVVRQVRGDISKYLLTLSVINVGLGIAVTVAMWLLGLPNPVLWGVMAGTLNFIPYFGPLVGIIVVSLVSLLTFDGVGRAAIAPVVYFLLNATEGSFVTPAVMGRRLELNPVGVFVGLLIWGWIWGIPGALMAVPIVATIKIVSDHYAPLQPLSVFLGR